MIQNLITFIQVLKINSRRTNHLIQFLPIFQINISKTTPKTQTHNPTPTPDTHPHTHTPRKSQTNTISSTQNPATIRPYILGRTRLWRPTERKPHQTEPPHRGGPAGGRRRRGGRWGAAGGGGWADVRAPSRRWIFRYSECGVTRIFRDRIFLDVQRWRDQRWEEGEKIGVELSKIWLSDGWQLVVSSRAFTRVV